MKFITVYIGNNKIELSNSIFGKESVTVNDAVVSEKSSVFGTNHHFTINEDGINANCTLTTGMGINGVVIDLYKNGNPIIVSSKFNSANLSMVFAFVVLLWVLLN